MNPFEIASALCSFQTLVIENGDKDICVFGKEGFEEFHAFLYEWTKKYPHKIMANWPSLEVDGIIFTPQQSEAFFADYPKLKRQLEINKTYGCNMWVEYPDGCKQEDIDLIWLPDEFLPEAE